MAKGIKTALRSIITSILMLLSSNLIAQNVIQLSVHDFIGPSTKDYLTRGIASAKAGDLVLIKIDSPGGLMAPAHDIVDSILNAQMPVIVFVSPQGGRVSGVGTFLLYASTVAAMADGSTLETGGPLQLAEEGGRLLNERAPYLPLNNEQIAMNEEYSYLRNLPVMRGRNSLFDEVSLRNATSLTAAEALQSKVINLVALDEANLIKQLNGYYVTQNGKQLQLSTDGAKIVQVHPDWHSQLLRVITQPTVAYLLILFGVYGIVFKLMLPRKYFSGILGGLLFITGLYALFLMPVDLSGLGFVFLGLALVMGELFSPSYGVLGIIGTISFIWGSKLLINTDHQDFQIDSYGMWIMAALNWIVFIGLFRILKNNQHLQPAHGVRMLIGAHGRTISIVNLEGQAIIHGEIWNVQSKQPIEIDTPISVVSVDGLRLEVAVYSPD